MKNVTCGRCGKTFDEKSRFYTEADGTSVCHDCMLKMVDGFREMVTNMTFDTYKPGDNVNCDHCGRLFVLGNVYASPEDEFSDDQNWFDENPDNLEPKITCDDCVRAVVLAAKQC